MNARTRAYMHAPMHLRSCLPSWLSARLPACLRLQSSLSGEFALSVALSRGAAELGIDQ